MWFRKPVECGAANIALSVRRLARLPCTLPQERDRGAGERGRGVARCGEGGGGTGGGGTGRGGGGRGGGPGGGGGEGQSCQRRMEF